MALNVLLLDNFDSFTWNLQHYLDAEGAKVQVFRNNEAIPSLTNFQGIVLSPGPGMPNEAGNLMPVLAEAITQSIPVLGVCLGMQAIVLHFGGTLRKLENPVHGMASECSVINAKDPLLQSISSSFNVGRYHSWAAQLPLPSPLAVSTITDDIPMSCFHPHKPIHAVQFHPESILTPHGRQLIANWLTTIKQ